MSDPRVVALHRYPVKSMLGEQLTELDLDERGGVGDRMWSVRTAEGKIGSGKTTRRFALVPGLLELRAYERAGEVTIAFPDGRERPARDASAELSRHLGQPVTLAMESDVSHFDDGPVSLVGLGSIAAVEREQAQIVDPTRFRPNIVVDTTEEFVEDGWVDHELQIGSARLRVTMTSPRCVMVDAPTADLPAQPGNLTAVGRLNRACLGIVASLVEPGRISLGDVVRVSRG